MLVIGAAALVVALLGLVLLSGTPQFVTCLVSGIVAVVMLVNGTTWTVLQNRMFGSPAAIARAASVPVATNATIVSVTPTSARVNNDPVVYLALQVGAETVERRVVVPFLQVGAIRPGSVLPVRLDPEGSKAIVVDWSTVPF
jgi:hypothetical protein